MMGAKVGFVILVVSAALSTLIVSPSNAQDVRNRAETEANHIVETVVEAFAESLPSIRFSLASDLRVATGAIWDRDGALMFPDVRLDHVQLELSASETTALFRLLQEGSWHKSALKPGGLIYCHRVKRTCLILNQSAFAEALGVSSDRLDDALFQPKAAITAISWKAGAAGTACLAACLLLAFFYRKGPRAAAPASNDPDQFTIADIRISPASLKAKRAGTEVALTRRDISILRYMHDRQDTVVSKDELYDAGWGRDYMPNSRALDQHILALRRKLNPDKAFSDVIETVHGAGYRLVT